MCAIEEDTLISHAVSNSASYALSPYAFQWIPLHEIVANSCFAFLLSCQIMPASPSSASVPSTNGHAHQNGRPAPTSRQRLASSTGLLPPEIWSLVLEQLPPSELQHTALSLSRAIPNSGVTLEVGQGVV